MSTKPPIELVNGIPNDVRSLKKGIVNTSKNKPYTILLVGEPGVGKSSFLQFIANVLTGNDMDHYTFDILDHTNEQANSNKQAQTKSARLYEITTTNGVVVRILDTPGLVNTHNVQESISTQVKDHIDSATAVLIVANGTVPCGTVGIGHALSTLSSIFPEIPTNNIALLFTNVGDPVCLNVCEDMVPTILQDAPQFQIDNPIALQKKYVKRNGDSNVKESRSGLREFMKAAEQDALEMVKELFDWLEGLEPKPTTTIPLEARPAAKEAEILAGVDVFSRFQKMIRVKPKAASSYNKLRTSVSNFYSTCSIRLHVLCGSRSSYVPVLSHFRTRGLRDLDYSACTTMDVLPWFAEGHTGRWEGAIWLVEQSRKDIEDKGVGQEPLDNMRHSLEQVKRTPNLVKVARKVWKGILKVKRIFIRA